MLQIAKVLIELVSNMTTLDENLIWQVRAFIYTHFAETTQAPSAQETASHFQISVEQAQVIYKVLGRRHALLLNAVAHTIRMANPFSAIPTVFQVHARNKSYWANCAWDALGIPAALGCEATIETQCAESNQPIDLSVRDGQVVSHGEVVHFLVPFRHWYDDLVLT